MTFTNLSKFVSRIFLVFVLRMYLKLPLRACSANPFFKCVVSRKVMATTHKYISGWGNLGKQPFASISDTGALCDWPSAWLRLQQRIKRLPVLWLIISSIPLQCLYWLRHFAFSVSKISHNRSNIPIQKIRFLMQGAGVLFMASICFIEVTFARWNSN